MGVGDWGDIVFGVQKGGGYETTDEHVSYYFFT